ncbi:unnamed protein product [Cuscuta epithymum]|uniref:Uncharacterized protein n=1 Tax=Cuscuta epithymum TaxID=186058 RepID=A0AAV0EUJ5_9ASTE|nr:unnamed protein product [Cuscuta epithymum]
MAENGVCCAAMYLCLGVIAAVLGLVTAYQVKPERVTVTSETVTGHCFSLIVAIEVVLAIVALVGDQIVAPAIFAVNGPNGDGNARPKRRVFIGSWIYLPKRTKMRDFGALQDITRSRNRLLCSIFRCHVILCDCHIESRLL